jgi:uncharacterized OB-fold protein
MTVAKIWRKIPEQYNLMGKKCHCCTQLCFPPREVCPKCGCYEMKDFTFSGKGNIATFTIIRTQQSEEELNENPCRKTPYILSIIQLEEGPMLTAEIVDCGIEEVFIGKKVEVVFRKILEKGEKGVIQYGYKFRLADD